MTASEHLGCQPLPARLDDDVVTEDAHEKREQHEWGTPT
jgi:hypothetical protein